MLERATKRLGERECWRREGERDNGERDKRGEAVMLRTVAIVRGKKWDFVLGIKVLGGSGCCGAFWVKPF